MLAEKVGSEQLISLILDHVNDGVVIADSKGTFVYWNTLARKVTNSGPADILPEQWSEYYGCFLPDKQTPFPSEQLPLYRAIRGEYVNDVLIYVHNSRMPEGAWLNVSASPIKNEEGNICGALASFQDVSSWKKENEDLSHSLRYIASLMQSIDHTLATTCQTEPRRKESHAG